MNTQTLNIGEVIILNTLVSKLLLVLLVFVLASTSLEAQTSVSTGHPSTTFLVGGAAVVIAPSLTVTASGTIVDVKISIETLVSGDVLDATVPGGFTKSWNNTTKTLTISGSGTASEYQSILRTVTFSTTSTSSPRRINFIMANVVSLEVDSKEHVYELVNHGSAISWTSAKAAAEAKTITTASGGTETGYLATITSSEENEFIRQKVSANTWIGASDNPTYSGGTEGNFYWVSGPENGTQFWTGGLGGSAFGGEFESWANNEPNNCCGGEDYAHLLGSSGEWNDYANTTAVNYYIVEYGGYPTSPTTIVASDYADVTITTNTPPVANNDTYNRFYTETGVSFTVAASGVLGNDTDVDGNALAVGTPRPATAVSQGSLTLNSNGSFSYTSPNSVKDQTATFTYYANDGTVNSSSAATVTINIRTPRFIGGGGNNNFNNPANWNCGYVPGESLNIIIEANQTVVFNQSYTCKNLQLMTGSSFSCTGGNTLTITGDVLDRNGNVRIDVANGSSLVVNSSIQIFNP